MTTTIWSLLHFYHYSGPPAQSAQHQILKISKCQRAVTACYSVSTVFRKEFAFPFLESNGRALLEQIFCFLVSSVTTVMRLSQFDSHVMPHSCCLNGRRVAQVSVAQIGITPVQLIFGRFVILCTWCHCRVFDMGLRTRVIIIVIIIIFIVIVIVIIVKCPRLPRHFGLTLD